MTPRFADRAQLVGLLLATGLLVSAHSSLSIRQPAVRAPAPDLPQARCRIVELGPYVATSDKLYVEDTRSVTGVSAITDDVVFGEHTSTIEAQLGGGFGVRYVAQDVPEGAVMRWHVKYPRAIRGFTEWGREIDVVAGDHAGHVLYDFDHEWEMERGAWKIEIEIDSPGRHATCGVAFTVK
jgi:hypothetical protein